MLCEYDPDESIDCSLRRSTLEWIQSHNRSSLNARSRVLPAGEAAAGVVADDSMCGKSLAFQAAIDYLKHSDRICIRGRVVSVAAARAVLALAEKLNAFVDIDGSEAAFRSISAVQRSGMVTASLSEVRFRSDLIVMIGDDRLLQAYPRLPERIASPLGYSHRKEGASENRRLLFLGNWSPASLARFELLACEVASMPIDLEHIPRVLHQWSRLTDEARSATSDIASQWISNAEYLAIVWSAEQLDFAQPDLWIERLFQWIGQRNEKYRCVGFPLSSHYTTFQQVCTWTTGFPGRVQFKNGSIEYHPLAAAGTRFYGRGDEGHLESTFDLEIRIDETLDPSRASPPVSPTVIHIAPCLEGGNHERVYLPCGIAGFDHDAELFRTDGTVVLKVEAASRSEPVVGKLMSASAWLHVLQEAL